MVFRPSLSSPSSTRLCEKSLLGLKTALIETPQNFFARVYTEHFATAKEIQNTNVMVSHHSVTAAANDALWHPAEWIVHSGSDPPPNLQITSNCQSEVCVQLSRLPVARWALQWLPFINEMHIYSTISDVSLSLDCLW